ncbi:hypothetical protein [Actinacidiphila acidipaludis]|uniref:Lipoprotein LpqN n=1 Tax=Actinacidiphila acidipaludis TaxID=2873382 RepID=A0ABS7QAV0_9ACTN|nr:hypothetical protein [Streptomyces acidipaludis]MBY8880310.1 hypothetical protein [Streptomyces acidipaludis]
MLSGSKVLSRQELNRLLLGEHELAGYDIGYIGDRNTPAPVVAPSSLPRVTPADCRSVYEGTEGLSAYPYSATVAESAEPTGPQDHQRVTFTLLSYTPATAPKVFTDLRAALPACASSTIHPSAGGTSDSPDFAHPRNVSSPHLGDDAISFRLTEVLPKSEFSASISLDMRVLLVREGSTVVVFTAESDSDPGKPATMPNAVVTAQLAKFRH